jgi:NADPH:quinone reductase-like Zn-dependent oxidoreductase
MPRELLLTGPRALELRRYEETPLEPGQVRAEAIVSGISLGTEIALYRGDSPFASKRFDLELRLFVGDASAAFPARLGYEWVGLVRESTVPAPRAGERIHVTLPHRETQTFFADGLPWIALPDGLSDERATLLQSAAIALQAVRDARIAPGDGVAVFGLGAFGLLAVQLTRLDGAGFVVGVDPLATRREPTLAYGADLTLDPTASDVGLELKSSGLPADAAIEFSGRYEALQQALRCVRVTGLVVAAGFYTGDAGALRLSEEWHHNRLTMVASMQGWGVGVDRKRLRSDALELLADGRLRVDELLSERAAFGSAPELYARIAEQPGETLRAVLRY